MANTKISELPEVTTMPDGRIPIVQVSWNTNTSKKISKDNFKADCKWDTWDTWPTWPTWPAGTGIPAWGTAGQVLSKIDTTDYNTQWATVSSKGFVTVWTWKDYTTLDLAIAAGQKNLICYGTLSTSSMFLEGSNIHLWDGSNVTYSYGSYTMPVNIRGRWTLIVNNMNFYNSMFNWITINYTSTWSMYITNTNCTYTGVYFVVSWSTFFQVGWNNWEITYIGCWFQITTTSWAVVLQGLKNCKVNVYWLTSYLTLNSITDSYIYPDWSWAGNEIKLQWTVSWNYIENARASTYYLTLGNSNARIFGNLFDWAGSYSSQNVTLRWSWSYDRFTFCNNIVTWNITLNTLDRWTFCNNLIGSNPSDITVSSVTKANNQTWY